MKKNNLNQKRELIFSGSVVFLLAAFFVFQATHFSEGAVQTDQVTLSVTVAEGITLNCGADVNLGTLTPGTPVSNSTTCTVTTNANGGYDLAVRRDDADTTMDHNTDATANITDKTAWNRTTPNAAAYSSTGLGFSVYASTATKNTTCWGTGSTCHEVDRTSVV